MVMWSHLRQIDAKMCVGMFKLFQFVSVKFSQFESNMYAQSYTNTMPNLIRSQTKTRSKKSKTHNQNENTPNKASVNPAHFKQIIAFEGYKFDPNGEYVRRWLPELARLPTEWIHHPWNAPESVLQAAGIELGSNYPLPIVEIDAAKARLQEALSQMWQHEAASRAALENGTEEGLGESEALPVAFPPDIQMDVDVHEPARNNNPTMARRQEDQMVPSMTSSLLRVEEEEVSLDLGNRATDSRAEVPTNVNVNQEPRREVLNQGVMQLQTVRNNATPPQFNIRIGLQNAEDSMAESSSNSSRRERDGGVVPVWSPSTSSYSEQFVGEENGIGTSSSFLQRHPQSHQLMNWRRLSQTG
ncbi:Cryptochrome-1 [Camellia lanceoleosa]|uniref:Cryptochrome-1 n=1 Tax=Camellia lanceoleosa TaxID=1840588 RepID=A0ACC0GQB4_9ERIC|nr:Cryptochrome-1 [Camellia lanceoleosa]